MAFKAETYEFPLCLALCELGYWIGDPHLGFYQRTQECPGTARKKGTSWSRVHNFLAPLESLTSTGDGKISPQSLMIQAMKNTQTCFIAPFFKWTFCFTCSYFAGRKCFRYLT